MLPGGGDEESSDPERLQVCTINALLHNIQDLYLKNTSRTAPRMSATARSFSSSFCPPSPPDGVFFFCYLFSEALGSGRHTSESGLLASLNAGSAGSALRAIPASSQAPQHNTDDLLDCTTAYRLHTRARADTHKHTHVCVSAVKMSPECVFTLR